MRKSWVKTGNGSLISSKDEYLMVYFFLALSALLPKSSRLLFILISFEVIILNVLILGSMSMNFTTFVFILVTGVISSVMGLLVLLSALNFFGNDSSIL